MIGFLQPLVLLGLATAAIPTVLHLLTRRVPPTVTFPAVRYLAETERRQSRRLKLRHLVLLLLRTALIVFVVLAAARPVASVSVGGAHAPTAIALVVDNSLSSGAVVEGRRVLDLLIERARDVVGRVAENDRLWLVLADELPRPMTPNAALAVIDSLRPSARRLDLGRAARAAAEAVASAPLAGREIVMLSDLQRSAFSSGERLETRVLAWTPGAIPENRSVDSAHVDPAIWSPGGEVVTSVGGPDGRVPFAVRLWLNGQDVARAVAAPGDRVVLAGRSARTGWLAARVALDPDELRADDDWHVAIRVAEPAGATAQPGAGRYVAEALAVLQGGGRAGQGNAVVLADVPGGERSVVVPPADPAQVGALNRMLAARGISWRLGDRLDGEWQLHGDIGPAEGMTVRRRYRLDGEGVVLARAGSEPWMVRSQDLVLLASRLEDSWTELPLTAAFVPFVDMLINRIAVGDLRGAAAFPGEVVELPPGVETLLTESGSIAVTGDRRVQVPYVPGIYFLRGASGDTVGALTVNHDPRESRLAEVDQRTLRAALGPAATLLTQRTLDRELFGGARRADLAGPFLLAALIAALAELAVSSLGARAGRNTGRG